MKIETINTATAQPIDFTAIHAAPAPVLVDTAALVAALSDVVLFSKKRDRNPLLNCAVVRIRPDGLTIETTNQEQSAAARLDCITDGGAWAFALDAHALLAAVKQTAAREIEFRPDGDRVAVIVGAVALQPTTYDAEHFRPLSLNPELSFATFPAASIAADLARVAPAMCTEQVRYYMRGIFLHAEAGALTMVATDGHRMHLRNQPLPAAWEAIPDVTAPAAFVTALQRVLRARHHKADHSISIGIAAKQIAVTLGALTIVSRVVDGAFPDYRRVIPGNFQHGLLTSTDALGAALDIIRPAILNAKAFAIATAENGPCTLRTCAADGSASAALSAAAEGEPYEVGFNVNYVGDILKAFGSAELLVQGHDAASPHLFSSADAPGFRVVLMPMRI